MRVPALVASLLAPLLIYWIVRSAALALPGVPAAFASTSLPPAEYSLPMKMLVRASQNPKLTVSGGHVAQARSALLAAPLAFEPFFVAAKAEEQANRPGQALRLMEEAKRRRPTHTGTRAQLLIYYGRRARYASFLGEMDYVLRRSEAAQHRLLPEMVKLLAVSEGRRALAPMLAAEPNWRENFFAVAGNTKVNPDDAADLVALIRATKRRGDLGPENRFYIQALTSAGQYRRAREVWAASLDGSKRTPDLVFDGAFRGSSAPPPFAWVLQDLDVGRATIADPKGVDAGLDVEYFGGKDAVLAEQTLALTPGRYDLSFLARSEGETKYGSLSWRLSCLPSGQPLLDVAVAGLSAENKRFGGSFTVPGGSCPGQRLQLVAEAGDIAGAVSARISQLSVRRK